ncbi:AzlD domain-containing protein [Flocculibacter collagenilyticus]|uniref:AzlD domain-containing protein n=1 Tax=Flocculibacter collagenilyticus TaxID=2744479 RepID=UPI0018F38589|nr:AzlD domain-containing protein [Flocculibacter collagenilyticus]
MSDYSLLDFVLIVIGMTAVTFSIRYVLIAFAGKFTLPRNIQDGLVFVPVAVLSALIVPALVMPHNHQLNLTLTNHYLLAGIVAFAVAKWTSNLLLTIALGLISYFLFKLLL